MFVAAFGKKGAGPGEFNDPTGIAVGRGEVFVSDSRHGRIQVFDLDGNFKRMFGKPGKAPGELGRPMHLAIHDDRLYVAEHFNDRIQVFKFDGTHEKFIGRAGNGPAEFDAPGGVAVAADGTIYVADFYNQRIQSLTGDGRFLRQWGETRSTGIPAGRFNYPTSVAVGPDAEIYVADGYNDRIQVFARDGRYLRRWGGPLALNIHGPFNGWFSTVTDVTVDNGGNVLAADFYNDRVQIFSADGTFLTAFGISGSGPGALRFPMAVAVAKDGAVFVVDFGNHRVQKWRPVR